MNKNFVSYEIALKLKELGFDEECFGYYSKQYDGSQYLSVYQQEDEYSKERLEALLWQQAVDFLETKGYYINISRIFQFNPLPITFSGWCIYIGTNNPKENLNCNSYFLTNFYSTKYEALEKAILKALELVPNESSK